jgi:hypothetical protein
LPKVELYHPETNPLPPELKEFLQKHFPESLLQKLERLGGRILISVTAPYSKDKKKQSGKVIVDDIFIQRLRGLSSSVNDVRQELSRLQVKQLRSLAKLLKHPLRSNATSLEIRTELLRSLTSEEFWKRISGAS